jgi:nitric-oxide synthase
VHSSRHDFCPATPEPPAAAPPGSVLAAASDFMQVFRRETRMPDDLWQPRWEAIVDEISRTGTYVHTAAELQFGCRIAWRNHTRCIGKLYWRTLQVRDCRTVSSPEGIRDELVEHLRLAGNGGRIKPVLSVFAPDSPGRPGPRILNDQLVRYAGHRAADGSIVGDPANLALTDTIRALGWDQDPPGAFDILPVAVEVPGHGTTLFELPDAVTPEVAITHPDHTWFASLGLRWYSFPTVSDMRLEIGGVSYPAAPFSGWYVAAEIGARNFGDASRYDMLPTVARHLGCDVSSARTLWKDRALVELNAAVLWSFEQAGVRIVDHHTMTDQFHRYVQTEMRSGREVNADWAWIVPPMSPSTTPVYHCAYDPTVRHPNFFRGAEDEAAA